MKLDPAAFAKAKAFRDKWNDGRLRTMNRDEGRTAMLEDDPSIQAHVLEMFLAQCLPVEEVVPDALDKVKRIDGITQEYPIVPINQTLFYMLAHMYGYGVTTIAEVAGVNQQSVSKAIERRMRQAENINPEEWRIPRTQRAGKGITRAESVMLHAEQTIALMALANWVAQLEVRRIDLGYALTNGRRVCIEAASGFVFGD